VTKDKPTGVHPLVGELRALRIHAGMSMSELARLSGVNVSTISEMEAGHYWPMLKSVDAYASALGVKLTWEDKEGGPDVGEQPGG
jgi:transcriptional regulator with XRE-family HTH domain